MIDMYDETAIAVFGITFCAIGFGILIYLIIFEYLNP